LKFKIKKNYQNQKENLKSENQPKNRSYHINVKLTTYHLFERNISDLNIIISFNLGIGV